jgi:GxxExxY protein
MSEEDLIAAPLSRSVIGAFYEVYNTLGYGFLESVYAASLEHELRSRGHRVAREIGVRVVYKEFDAAFQRLDMVVDAKLIIEAKSTEILHAAAKRQLYNYLRATGLEVGLLLHFALKPAFHRIICRRR